MAANPSGQADAIWPRDRWWERTNWEEATILLAGLHSDDCTPVIDWVAEANPEVAAQCILRSGAHAPRETLLRLRAAWHVGRAGRVGRTVRRALPAQLGSLHALRHRCLRSVRT